MAKRSSRSQRSVRVKGHGRSPRGPNRGKRRVKVKRYSRSRPSRH